MSWYVGSPKQKIAIISLGKMPNGEKKMPSAKIHADEGKPLAWKAVSE